MARKKGPQVQQAYDYIKDKIINFELAPGMPVSDHALEQELEGQVWELTVAEEQLPDVAQYGTVCGVSRQQEGILVRLLSAAKPPLPCAPARPDLEDVYLFHFGEGATL